MIERALVRRCGRSLGVKRGSDCYTQVQAKLFVRHGRAVRPLSVSLLSVLVSGCSASGEQRLDPASHTQPIHMAPISYAHAGTTARDRAVQLRHAHEAARHVAAARCGREASCGRIGPARLHTSPAECERKLVSDALKEFGPAACPAGLNNERVRHCIHVIGGGACDSALGELERIVACGRRALCSPRPKAQRLA
jgi:hypothetical protein